MVCELGERVGEEIEREGTIDVFRVFALDGRDKGRSTDYVEGSNTKELLWVKYVVFLQNFSKDGDG